MAKQKWADAASNVDQGKIFLQRSIRNHWIWEDPRFLKWWVDLVMEANYKDAKVLIGYEVFTCGRGQSLNSLETWGKRWKVDKSSVRRFFNLLEKDGMIKRENVQKTTRITICNYDTYNSLKHDKQPQRNSDATAKQLRSNSDATQTIQDNTVNTGNTGEGYGNTPPPSPRGDKYSEDQKTGYAKFQQWVSGNAGQVGQMKEPFTIDEYLKLKAEYKTDFIQALLIDMHNWQPLAKKNRSAYRTFCKWAKRDRSNLDPSKTTQAAHPAAMSIYSQQIKEALATGAQQ